MRVVDDLSCVLAISLCTMRAAGARRQRRSLHVMAAGASAPAPVRHARHAPALSVHWPTRTHANCGLLPGHRRNSGHCLDVRRPADRTTISIAKLFLGRNSKASGFCMQTQTFTAGAGANAHSSSSARPSSWPHAWRTTARSIACSLSTVSQEKRTIDIERVRAN